MCEPNKIKNLTQMFEKNSQKENQKIIPTKKNVIEPPKVFEKSESKPKTLINAASNDEPVKKNVSRVNNDGYKR